MQPKAKSLRSRASAKAAHKPAAKANPISESEPRAFAASDDPDEEVVDTGEPSDPQIQLSKREKREMKHQLFISQITGGESPPNLSRSARRREKRKQKERLAADLSALKSILELESSGPCDVDATGDAGEGSKGPAEARSKSTVPETVLGKIGESQRSKPLTKAQRKRALRTEQLRLPHILAHPSFVSDSFGTIRTHTQNVFVRMNE